MQMPHIRPNCLSGREGHAIDVGAPHVVSLGGLAKGASLVSHFHARAIRTYGQGRVFMVKSTMVCKAWAPLGDSTTCGVSPGV